MAVIKINPHKEKITKTPAKGIGYIIQEGKSFSTKFYHCTKENFDKEWNMILNQRKVKRIDNRTYYHIKQTFAAEDKISEEKAIIIGQELAEYYSNQGFQVVLTSHNDTDHLHNHIIVNAVNMMDYSILNSDGKELDRLLQVSDLINKNHQILTLEELKNRNNINPSKHIGEIKAQEDGTLTHKDKIKMAMDSLIEKNENNSLESLFLTLEKEYGITGKIRGSFIVFEIDGRKFRGTTVSEFYSKENLTQIFEEKKYSFSNEILSLIKASENYNIFCTKLLEQNILLIEEKDTILFSNGKETLSLRQLGIWNKYNLEKEIYMWRHHNEFSTILNSIQSLSVEDYLQKLKNNPLVTAAYIKNKSIYIKSSNYNFDIKCFGSGSNFKNEFSLPNIERGSYINFLNDQISSIKKENTTIVDIIQHIEQLGDSIVSKNNNLYIQHDKYNINLNRFLKQLDADNPISNIKLMIKKTREIQSLNLSNISTGLQRINKEMISGFYKHLRYVEKLEEIDSSLYKINKDPTSYVITDNSLNKSFKIPFDTLEKAIYENIKTKIYFEAIKNETTMDDFEARFISQQIPVQYKKGKLWLDGTKFSLLEKKGDAYEFIQEQLDRNHDREFGGKKSIYTRFKNAYFNQLKRSTTINDFLSSPSFKKDGNRLIYIENGKSYEATSFNFGKSDYFSFEKTIEKIETVHSTDSGVFDVLKATDLFVRSFQQKESQYHQNKLSQKYFEYIRKKQEYLEYKRRNL